MATTLWMCRGTLLGSTRNVDSAGNETAFYAPILPVGSRVNLSGDQYIVADYELDIPPARGYGILQVHLS